MGRRSIATFLSTLVLKRFEMTNIKHICNANLSINNVYNHWACVTDKSLGGDMGHPTTVSVLLYLKKNLEGIALG